MAQTAERYRAGDREFSLVGSCSQMAGVVLTYRGKFPIVALVTESDGMGGGNALKLDASERAALAVGA